MFGPSVRIQTYFVCGVMIACFSILYPKIFHPLLMHYLGFSKPTRTADEGRSQFSYFFDSRCSEYQFLKQQGLYAPGKPKPTIRSSESNTQSGVMVKRGGIMTVVLPVYGVGIVLYLIYTLSKVYKSTQRNSKKDKRDEFLKHYYRDFHYDINRGKFRMGHGSSSEEEDNPQGDGFLHEQNPSSSQNSHSGKSSYVTKDGCFDWAAAYGTENHPNIYRSAKDLPRDLEALLIRMESDNISHEELSSLRARLEKTECEMTKLLQAMNEAERAVLHMSDRTKFDLQNDDEAFQRDSEFEVSATEEEFGDPLGTTID